jgi:predicted RNA methylase
MKNTQGHLAITNLLGFHKMLIDDYNRTFLYRKAIMRTVRNGDVVIDIGTGTGVLALFACHAGAKRVYAVEREDTIALARELVRENGLDKKVIFIKSNIDTLNIKEKADVIISELISNFGVGQSILKILTDGRNIFLKDRSKIIPATLEMHLVPVEEGGLYKEISFLNNKEYIEKYNIDFLCFQKMAVNNIYFGDFRPQNFLARCKKIYDIDFRHNNTKNQGIINNRIQFRVSRRGVFHGFCGFFRSCLAPGVWLTNKPIAHFSAWTNVFFPLEEPVYVNARDRIKVTLAAFESQWKTLYKWKTSITPAETDKHLSSIREFDQNNLIGEPVSLDTLLGVSDDYIPDLSEKGKKMASLLNLCNGKMTLRDIAKKFNKARVRKNKNPLETSEDIRYMLRNYYASGLLEYLTAKERLHI